MASDNVTYPQTPNANGAGMPPGSAIMPEREVNFADPGYGDGDIQNDPSDDLLFPKTPKANEEDMPPGSAIMPEREINFADPTYSDITQAPPAGLSSPFKPAGLTRSNSDLSNADQSVDYDFSIFNSYVHYEANPAGGQGLLDRTPSATAANVIYTRSNTFTVYSPYG